MVASRYAADGRVSRKIDNIHESIRIFAVLLEGEYREYVFDRQKRKIK